MDGARLAAGYHVIKLGNCRISVKGRRKFLLGFDQKSKILSRLVSVEAQ